VGTAVIKGPKLYWSDEALARHLAGGEAVGAHLENLVLSDLLVQVPGIPFNQLCGSLLCGWDRREGARATEAEDLRRWSHVSRLLPGCTGRAAVCG